MKSTDGIAEKRSKAIVSAEDGGCISDGHDEIHKGARLNERAEGKEDGEGDDDEDGAKNRAVRLMEAALRSQRRDPTRAAAAAGTSGDSRGIHGGLDPAAAAAAAGIRPAGRELGMYTDAELRQIVAGPAAADDPAAAATAAAAEEAAAAAAIPAETVEQMAGLLREHPAGLLAARLGDAWRDRCAS
jgi:hypothetical protein